MATSVGRNHCGRLANPAYTHPGPAGNPSPELPRVHRGSEAPVSWVPRRSYLGEVAPSFVKIFGGVHSSVRGPGARSGCHPRSRRRSPMKLVAQVHHILCAWAHGSHSPAASGHSARLGRSGFPVRNGLIPTPSRAHARTLREGTERSGYRRQEQIPVDAVQVVALLAARTQVGLPRFGVGLGQALAPDNEPGDRAHHPGAV